MKSDIFSFAIYHRNQLRFHYDFDEVLLDPFYVSKENTGKRVIYGRINNTSEIKKFEFDKIVNLRILDQNKFSSVIPVLA